MEVDVATFEKTFRAYFQECIYNTLKAVLRTEFLAGIDSSNSSVIKEINSFRQRGYDQTMNKAFSYMVDEYYQKFTEIASQFTAGQSFPINIMSAFFAGLNQEITDNAITECYQVPPVPPNELKHAALERLKGVKDKMLKLEGHIQNTQSLACKAVGPGGTW